MSYNVTIDLDRLHQLPTKVIGRTLHYHPTVGSTNDLVRAEARAGQPEGLVVLTDHQTGGRGRMGRGWLAPPNTSLLLSLLLLRPWLAPADAFSLTMLAGVALCEAVEHVAAVPAALKWPNDLMLRAPDAPQHRKAAGILSEIELVDNQIAAVVIGMGVNVNWSPRGTVDGRDLAAVATSVAAAAGHMIDRTALLGALLLRLDTHYVALRRGHSEALWRTWQSRLLTLGQTVTVRLPDREVQGMAEGVSLEGALLLREANGTLHTITAGDVGA